MSNTPETKKPRSQWRPLTPVPDDAPAPRLSHPVRGEPTHIHTYRDDQGRVMGYVCRFIRSAGGVHNLTLTWCINEEDRHTAWKWIQFRKFRPVYRAEDLDPERMRIVMIVANELVVDEMMVRKVTYASENNGKDYLTLKKEIDEGKLSGDPFAAYDLVSWPGGRGKLGEVDWSCLRGRICSIWLPHSQEHFKVAKGDPQSGHLIPLERQPWRVAARQLKETLVAFGAVPISIAEAATSEELPDGWDPVAALSSGWDFRKLAEWYNAHFATADEIEAARALAAGTSTPSKASPTDPDWMRTLIREEGVGRLLAELANVRAILSQHEKWRGVIYMDTFAHSVMKAKPPPVPGGEIGEWRDYDDSASSVWLAENCGILKLKTSLVAEGVQMIANQAARNPLVEFLKGLKWDKTPRLDNWLREYINAGAFLPDMTEADSKRLEDYLRIVGRKWLIGAVKRAMQPGCKFDYVLILEGQQGLGKSTAFSILGGEWFMDTPFSLGDKEGMETIRGMWMIEIGELDGFNKVEDKTAKSFFSRTKDRFRLPYAKRSTTFKRACVFGATTNEDEYFRDPTGNRRYWPVYCNRKGYDHTKLAAVRDQLLAEAVAMLGAGEQVWPTRSEEDIIREQQRKREIPDPWVGRIATWLKSAEATTGRITRERILSEVLKIEVSRLDERSMATRVGKALHRLGYVKDEDKSLPERFFYTKRQDDEGDGS